MGFAGSGSRIDRHGVVVIDEPVRLQSSILILVSDFLQLDACGVADLRENLRAQRRIVFEDRIEYQHAHRRRLALLERFDTESIVRREYELGSGRRIITLDFIDFNEVFQEKSDHCIVDSGDCLHHLFRTGLDECGNPFHERPSDKRVFAPAVQIDETTHLLAREQRQ